MNNTMSKKNNNKSPWQVLGLEPGASQEEIKTAFKRLALSTHPDKGGSSASFAEINEAYNTLKSKKFVPVLNQPSTVMVNVELNIKQQIRGVDDVVIAWQPSTREEIAIRVKIPPGAQKDDKFKIVDNGKHYIICIKEKQDKVFTRDDFNVILVCSLDIITLMVGGIISVTDPCGESLEIEILPGTHQEVFTISNKGLYNRKRKCRGDLKVIINPSIPSLNILNVEQFIANLKNKVNNQ